LFSKDLYENTGLFHLTGVRLAPPAEPESASKLFHVLYLGGNLFLRKRRLDKRQERECEKIFDVRCKRFAGDGSKSGKGDHFSERFATWPIVLCCSSAASNGQADQEGSPYRSPRGVDRPSHDQFCGVFAGSLCASSSHSVLNRLAHQVRYSSVAIGGGPLLPVW
jgi:hypothetical protein